MIESCDRHANAILDLNNIAETHRVEERGRAAKEREVSGGGGGDLGE